MFRPSKAPASHEDLFVGRYDVLVRMALQLTHGDRVEAEDLVQEAFVRFTLARPDLAAIRSLDSYFFMILRNMRLSRVRRAAHTQTSLSVADWDSAEAALNSLDERAWLQARDDLRAACRYGCLRRESSKTGSVFLLRFFHGYVPSEIARVIRTSPRIIDEWLRLSRREARLYLTDPQKLAWVASASAESLPRHGARANDDAPADGDAESALSPAVFLRELQSRIFALRHRRCFPPSAIARWYRNGETGESLDTDILAQLVCCPVCLERAGRLLGFAEPSDRFPPDTLGPNARRPSNSGPDDARRRAKEVYEHRPQELRVVVNGFIVGVQRVSGDVSDLTVTVNQAEPIGLVELFSEQDVCLAAVDIDAPPQGTVEQAVHVALSDGKSAELAVSFAGPWPTVRAIYRDPEPPLAAASTAATDGAVRDDAARAFASMLQSQDSHLATAVTLGRLRDLLVPRTWQGRLALVALAAWLLFFTPGAEVSAATRIGQFIARAAAGLTELWRRPTPLRSSSASPAWAPLVPAPRAASPGIASAWNVPAAPARAMLTPVDAAALELAALARLQQVDAYLGQEIALGTRHDRIEFHALVSDAGRRQAVLRALGSLPQEGDVRVDVRTIDDAVRRRQPARTAPTAYYDFAFTKDRIPVYDTLRAYYAATAGHAADATGVDDAVRRFAGRMIDRSRTASQHAWTLAHLRDRYPPATVRALDADATVNWRTLLRAHAVAFEREIAALRTELQPIFAPRLSVSDDWTDEDSTPRGSDPPTPDDVSRAIDDLAALDRVRDAAMRAAFAVTSDRTDANAIETDTFWRSLRDAGRLARTIERPRPSSGNRSSNVSRPRP